MGRVIAAMDCRTRQCGETRGSKLGKSFEAARVCRRREGNAWDCAERVRPAAAIDWHGADGVNEALVTSVG